MMTETLMTGTDEGAQAIESQSPTDHGQADQPTSQAENSLKDEATAEKPEGAPERYEFKAAEGMAFDPRVMGVFSEVAKELNLPQAAAQKVLDRMASVIQSSQVEQVKAVSQGWAETSTSDAEFGGAKLQENLGVAKAALDKFGSPELKGLLNESGLGNHPEVIRLLYRAGRAISQDGIVSGAPSSGNVSKTEILYPNHK